MDDLVKSKSDPSYWAKSKSAPPKTSAA
jgi:hypothetical protein